MPPQLCVRAAVFLKFALAALRCEVSSAQAAGDDTPALCSSLLVRFAGQ